MKLIDGVDHMIHSHRCQQHRRWRNAEKPKNASGRRANEFTNTRGRYQRVDSESENHLKICIHSVFINSFACQRPAEGISIEIGEILIIEFIAFQLYD